jgi:hypothetical protein
MATPRKLPWEGAADGSSDKILSLAKAGRKVEPNRVLDTLDLVHRSTALIRAETERFKSLEARSRTLLERAEEEIEHYRSRAEDAEARASDAEARVRELEEQLKALHNALIDGLEEVGGLNRDSNA